METALTNELIREVLNINVQTKIHKDDLCSDNILIYWEFDGYHNECRNINIYELANKCKEWIVSKGLSYAIYYDDSFKNYKCTVLQENCNDGFDSIGDTFVSSTEIEAVFKACEWILNKLKG